MDGLGLDSLDMVIANAGANKTLAMLKDVDLDDFELTWRVNVCLNRNHTFTSRF